MDVAAEMPLQIGNLKSAKSDKFLMALGIEGSANKVKMKKAGTWYSTNGTWYQYIRSAQQHK